MSGRFSSFGSVRPGIGSSFSSPASSTVFRDLRMQIQTVTNAFTAPTDTPTSDIERTVEDAGGNRVKWTYRLSTGAWKGVQLA